ncbi:hypothetical protein ABZV65_30585 [Streptomyces bauhiniae]|uniref:hypothetical protein n=1 Tax=Streptomyces bauhiniae TaxID=2340725 RepID=UPI0033B4D9C8
MSTKGSSTGYADQAQPAIGTGRRNSARQVDVPQSMSDTIPAGHEMAAALSEAPEQQTFSESVACVQVSASLTVNGRSVGYEQSVPPHQWQAISADPAWREAYERLIRRGLVEALVDALNPPVVVRMPTPVDEAIARSSAGWQCCPDQFQGAAADGAGEPCQRRELGSEA